MKMKKVISAIAVGLGLIILSVGVILNNLIMIVMGPIVAILLFVVSYVELAREKKRKIFLPQDKYEPVLSVRPKHIMSKKRILGIFLYIIVAFMIFSIIWVLLTNYLYKPSSLSIENIINDGCKQLNPGTGRCEKNPSTIIVKLDVNENGKIGDVGDNLRALLESQECFGGCINVRCGCLR